MNGVLVDRELLKEAKLIAECFASSRHAAASVQKNPAVAAALLEEMERAERLEGKLRAALALPAQAAADAAGVLRLAADLVDAEQAWERARYGSPEARAAHGASWDAVKGMYQVGAARLRALADALEVQG